MNILTFDVEEWFHLLDFDGTRTENEWQKFSPRIVGNVDRILEILDRTDTKATFFVIGWIAKNYPEVVRKISSKYQIGSHTMNHQLVWQQTRKEFRNEVDSSIKLLEDITGKPVDCFRAPGFSIRETELWAFDVLAEYGIKYDCSIFPAKHAHGGMPSFGNSEPTLIQHNNYQIKEFPVNIKSFLGKNFVFNGGGYFRMIPYDLLSKWSSKESYLLSYIHPRDLDSGQPIIKGLPLSRRFKSYVGLKSAAWKLEKYLTDYHFIDVETAANTVDWKKTPIINL